jgi:hypothetical protein
VQVVIAHVRKSRAIDQQPRARTRPTASR